MVEENKNREGVNQTFENVHWADNNAQKVIKTFPNEKTYIVASGVTPSGIIHIGHFREIITSELVRKGLENKGKKTKFIYSWDSYDAFRKVPKNVPKEWNNYLRLPDSEVPDPNKKYDSFGERLMQEAEESLKVFNFPIEFQRQHKLQTSGIYANGIKNCLQKLDEIRNILNKFRSKPLGKEWFPLTVYSEKTGKDTTKVLNYDGEFGITYKCEETGFENTIDIRKTPIVKLAWRLDWPMRWNHYKVCYEPGGKDHSTPGSSYDTGKEIVKVVFDREAPVYTFYNFIGMKGQGGKVSSSDGNGATVGEALKIYNPQMILFIFAGTRPNAEFDISFDLDVIKIYEDFDKLERLYFGLEEEKNPKKLATLRRTYELSIVNGTEIPKVCPFQPSFRHLVTVSQANEFNFEKVEEFFKNDIKTKFDKDRIKERFECVKNWIELYAPEEMKFNIVNSINCKVLTENQIRILKRLYNFLSESNELKALISEFKSICSENNLEMKEFFRFMYKTFLNKEKGPKLSSMILENKTKIIDLLKEI